MRHFIAIVTALFLVLAGTVATANDSNIDDTWKELDQTSDKIVRLVQQNQYEEAKQLLDYFSKLFVTVRYDEANLTMNDLRVITSSYDKAFEAVTALSLNPEDRMMKVTEFRLVIDAVVSEHHPLWLHSQKSVLNSIDRLKETVKEQENETFQHQVNSFLRQYEMIRPALMIDLKADEFGRLDSHIQFLDNYRAEIIRDPNKQAQLTMLKEDFQRVYEQGKKKSADTSLLWVIFSIGGMIIISLTYVGWKKYKAEKRKVRMHD